MVPVLESFSLRILLFVEGNMKQRKFVTIHIVQGCPINDEGKIWLVTTDRQKALKKFQTLVLKKNPIKDSPYKYNDKESIECLMRQHSRTMTFQEFYDRWHTAVGWCDIPSIE